MSKRKANIRPDLVGELFLKPGEDIPYRLILCNTEPTAQIQRVDRTTPDDPVGISGLSGLVLLKPVRPIEKPKKPRADLGGTHKKPRQKTGVREAHAPLTKTPLPLTREGGQGNEPEIKVDNLTIHVPTGLEGDMEYKVNIAGSEASGPMLRLTVLEALQRWDFEIPAELSEYERATVQGILEAGE